MRGLREAAAASRLAFQPLAITPSTARVCVICQFRSQQIQRRTFSRSSRRANASKNHVKAATSPATGSHIDLPPTSSHTTPPSSQEPEFEFDIEPEDPVGYEERPRKPLSAAAAEQLREKQAKTAARRLERAKQIEAQEVLLKVNDAIEEGTDSTYEPAQEAKGLDFVGAQYGMPSAKFRPFALSSKSGVRRSSSELDQAHRKAAAYRAVVETFAAVASGQSPLPLDYRPKELLSASSLVQIEATQGGEVRLHFPSEEVEQEVLSAGEVAAETSEDAGAEAEAEAEAELEAEAEAEAEAETPQTQDIAALVSSWGGAWLHIPLTDQAIKLGIIKRITFLTGLRIPDHTIHNSRKMTDLLGYVARPDPPTKIAELLKRDVAAKARASERKQSKKVAAPLLLDIPNVKYSGRKVKVQDKENDLGRWKLIEHELERRGLNRD